MTEACSTLFGTAVEVARAVDNVPSTSYPGVRFELDDSAGRRVTGSLHLDQANPMGRQVCRVNYMRPAYWEDEHHLAALQVAAHWFRDIGGIGLLAKRQLCHIVPRLKAGQEERSMHWAVEAYALAEWQRTHKAWTSIGRFFKSDAYDAWLERSPRFQEHLDALQHQREDTERARRKREEIMPPGQLATPLLRQHYRLAMKDAAMFLAARTEAARQAYTRLTAREQSALRSQCEHERAGSWDGAEGRMTMEHPGFAAYVWNRALHNLARREGTTIESLAHFRPQTPYKLRELRDAMELRGLRGEP